MGDLTGGVLVAAGICFFFTLISLHLYNIPVRIRISGSRKEGAGEFHASLGWGPADLWVTPDESGWRVEVRIGSSILYQQLIEQESGDTDLSRAAGERGTTRNLLRYIPLIKPLFKILVHHTRIGVLSGDIRFGAGDPVTTGLVFGYFHAIRPLITGKTCNLTMNPDFDRLIVEGEGKAMIEIICPFGMVVRIAAMLFPMVLSEILPEKNVMNQGVVHA